jgi:DtxR family Mn-dependent transcriptional regulator
MDTLELSSSLEDYLEVLYHIIKEKQAARAKDIVNKMKVTAASVTGALRLLSEKGLINYAPYDLITFTDSGKNFAREIVRRHEVLKEFLTKVLSVDEAEADDAACKMEHSISKNILEKFIQFIEFVELCPRGGSKWINGFSYQCHEDNDYQTCLKCTEEVVENLKTRIKENVMSVNENISLRSLEIGKKAKIVKIQARTELKKRLIDMGFIKDSIVEIERIAPLGDPIDVRIKGYHLSIRKEDADLIFVMPLE